MEGHRLEEFQNRLPRETDGVTGDWRSLETDLVTGDWRQLETDGVTGDWR
jgi:hypothetical protein